MSAHLLVPLGLGGILSSTLVALSLVAGPAGSVVALESAPAVVAPVVAPTSPATVPPPATTSVSEVPEGPVLEPPAAEPAPTAPVEEVAAVPVEVVVAAPAPAPRSAADVAHEELSRLPGSDGVDIALDPPALGDHLGTVDLNHPDEIMVNTGRLAGDEARTRDVVRHEMGHIYQGRLGLAHGFEPLESALMSAFGGDADTALERSADCVAVHFGATWTHHTSDCAAPDKVAAVQALVEARMP